MNNLDKIRTHESFLALTVKQQNLVLAYLSNGGDRLKAVKAAYRCKDESARVMACTLFIRPTIATCLAVAKALESGQDIERAKFDVALEAAIRKSNSPQITGLRLQAQLRGYVLSTEPEKSAAKPVAPAAGEHRFRVGDIVQQLDENGQPHRFRIEATEIE